MIIKNLKLMDQQINRKKTNIYDCICHNIKENGRKIALDYFDTKITYHEFVYNIEQTADALLNSSIKKGDIVSIIMPITPESLYLLYGLNKIGAIANFIDPRNDTADIEKNISESNSKLLFIIDIVSDKINIIQEKKLVKEIINVSIFESMNDTTKLKQIKKLILDKKLKENTNSFNATKQVVKELTQIKNQCVYNENVIPWRDFFNKGDLRNIEKYKTFYYNENDQAIIINKQNQKRIVLTNENINNMINNYDLTNNSNIMPLFIESDFPIKVHLPLFNKNTITYITDYNLKELLSQLKKQTYQYQKTK